MKTRMLGLSLLVAASIAATGCNRGHDEDHDHDHDHNGHDHDHDHDHDHHEAGAVRALVSDADGTLRLYDMADGDVVWTHAFDGIGAAEISGLRTSEEGRYGLISLRGDANALRFLDSGVLAEEHGDHVHLEVEPPQLLDYQISGADHGASRLAHVVSRDGRISAFFDGEPDLTTNAYGITIPLANLGASAPEAPQVNSGNRHHGVSIPAAGGTVIMSVAEGVGTARTGVRVYDGLNEVAAFPQSCAGLHGYAVIGNDHLFGCANDQGGVLVVSRDEATGAWSERQVDFPAGAALGVSNFAAHAELPFALAPWGNQAFIRVDPAADAMLDDAVLELPAQQCGYVLRDDNAEHLLVLTVDGVLRAFDATDWSEGPTLQVTSAFTCSGTVPALMSVGSYAYVMDPHAGELLEIEIEDDELELHETIELTGEPRRITLFRHPAGLEDHQH